MLTTMDTEVSLFQLIHALFCHLMLLLWMQKSQEKEKRDETLPAPTETAGELVAGETEILDTPVETSENVSLCDVVQVYCCCFKCL
jgi:hypothetical protein